MYPHFCGSKFCPEPISTRMRILAGLPEPLLLKNAINTINSSTDQFIATILTALRGSIAKIIKVYTAPQNSIKVQITEHLFTTANSEIFARVRENKILQEMAKSLNRLLIKVNHALVTNVCCHKYVF